MIDLIIHNGDLALHQNNISDDEVGNTLYHIDLPLRGREEVLSSLLRRAIETPITHIGRYIIDRGGVRRLDLNYGNGLYLELSEPVGLDWVKRAEDHMKRAISFLPSEIKILSLNILPDGYYSVRVDLRYQIEGQREGQLETFLSLEDINES